MHKLFFELVPQQGGERKQDKTKGDLKFLRTVKSQGYGCRETSV